MAQGPFDRLRQIFRGRDDESSRPGPAQQQSQSSTPQNLRQSTATYRIARDTGRAKHFLEKLGDGVVLDMVQIPGGMFTMGSPEDEPERLSSEGPQHRVTVQSFFMGRYPVTRGEWRAVARMPKQKQDLDLEPSNFKGDDRLPVERVSWHNAQEFCARLSAHTKRTYRLPSEAEWEYACRAGTTTAFHFGETIATDLANYRGTEWKEFNETGIYGRGVQGEYREKTTQVGQFPANDFGLHDMHGNVWEWCQDHWHDNYDDVPKDGSAWIDFDEEASERSRLLRGGSWLYFPGGCRSAYRYDDSPDLRSHNYGFRVVCVSARTP